MAKIEADWAIPAAVERAKELLVEGAPAHNKKLRQEFGLTSQIAKYHLRIAEWELTQAGESGDHDTISSYAEKRIETLQQENKKLKKRQTVGEALCTALRESAEDLQLRQYETPEQARHSAGESPEELVTPINDVHLGERIDPDDIQGLGEYDLEIFKRRLENYQQGVLEHLASKNSTFGRVHVPFLGDIVDNVETFSGQRAHIAEQSAYQQVRHAVEAFAEHLHWLRKRFEEVIVYGVPGNHGVIKMGRKRADLDPRDNWDYIFYSELERRLEEVEGIEFHCTHEWFQIAEIAGTEFFFYHGDDLNTYLGMPANTSLNRMMNNIQDMIGRQPDNYILGHWHPDGSVRLNRLFICGNWPGTNNYSSKRLFRGSLPGQLIFAVHPKWKVTWRADIRLEEPGTYEIDTVIKSG